MICQKCGVEAPTKYVAFYQNIGLLFMRLIQSTEGHLCKPCIHSTFWTYFAINLTLGWWGLISLIINPFLILNNVVRYLMCLGMESPAPGATVAPPLDEYTIRRLQPHTESLIGKLKAGEPIEKVLSDVAYASGTTEGQVSQYLRAIFAAAQQRQ